MREFESLSGSLRLRLAASIAGGVALLALLTRIVLVAFSLLATQAFASQIGYGFAVVASHLTEVALVVVPFALGCFLSLWLLAPITAELRLTHVVTRSLLATLAGGVVLLVVHIAFGLLRGMYTANPFGPSFAPFAGELGAAVGSSLTSAFAIAVPETLNQAPAVALAGVLTWIWLGRRTASATVLRSVDGVRADEV